MKRKDVQEWLNKINADKDAFTAEATAKVNQYIGGAQAIQQLLEMWVEEAEVIKASPDAQDVEYSEVDPNGN